MRGVASVFGVGKRLLVGRPMRSGRLGHTLLPKKIALPVFASDALSSVAYATEEILLVLSAGGLALLHYTPYVAVGVGLLMLVVVASYRQNVHAYPSGDAATTLALLGIIAVSMFAGVTALALASHVHAGAPQDLIGLPADRAPRTVIAQVGRAVFGDSSPLFYILQFATAVILVLATNTAFNGFPVLASILAKDGYLPRQLRTRGDRLAFSNGILLLSGFAILLKVAFNASPTRLIQLYIIGVFVSFVCSQSGMIRHWNRLLRATTDQAARQHMIRTRAINTVGATFTAVVLVIVLATKFLSGAWIVVLAMPLIWFTMRAIHGHYASTAVELAPPEEGRVTLPASNRAIVLVSKLHLPTLRALAYARTTRPSLLEAVTIDVDEHETAALEREWDRLGIQLPLTVVASPYREITRPVIEYVKRVRRESPRDIVTVYIPQYVPGHWWEQLLHNQSALRLKSRLLYQPGVIVATVPYQMRSAAARTASGAHAGSNGQFDVPPADRRDHAG